jgi:hypothetical protein
VYLLVNAGVNGFQLEIVTGNEQGKNRRDNRENVRSNRKPWPAPVMTVFFNELQELWLTLTVKLA